MSEHKSKNWRKIKENSEIEQAMEEVSDVEEQSTEEAALDYPSNQALKEALTLAEQKAHENWEKSVRAMAELDNVRRRSEQDVIKAHRYGAEKLITSLLPVLDSVEQALQMADKETQPAMYEGLELTLKLFHDTLEKQNVQKIDPQGEMFNPQEHEAMSIQDIEGATPNSVLMVFQKGYKLNDRVIRPARVIVAKPKNV